MTQKMSKDQFQDWKDSAEWFFHYLAEKAKDCDEEIKKTGLLLAEVDPVELPALHKTATILGAKLVTIQEVLELDEVDIFGEDEDDE